MTLITILHIQLVYFSTVLKCSIIGYVTVFNSIFCSQFLLLQTMLQWIASYIEHMQCNLQEWSTEWSRAKDNRVLPRECTVHSKHLCQQHKRRLYTWTSPDGQYQNQVDYILCSQRWRSSIQSAKIRMTADCGSNHKLLIGKFRLKLKKVRKTTRPFRWDLSQIPYDYTAEVRNRFKGLDLIEYLKNYGRRFVHTVQEGGISNIPKKKKCKKENGCERVIS